MQNDRWKQIEQLFAGAQDQPPERRFAFLREACQGDAGLQSEVESLLKAAESHDSLLDGQPLSSIAGPPPAVMPGDVLGNFQIVSLLGRGGMGEVWRARDLRLGREVALKILPPELASDPDRVSRFEREARAASALNHPNIIAVHDIGRHNGISYIVSELAGGETLSRVIERGPLLLRTLIDVGTQISNGLAAAHSAGIVHRDLKPGNIMLTREGRVKILDFGLARQDTVPGTEGTTATISHPGVILGTPGYMSPEQVRGEIADTRSDLFSLGVILYEMASGKPAFRGSSSIEVMNAILKDDPPPLDEVAPPALARVVHRCLEKRPEKRFQTASDLEFALTSLPDASRTGGTGRRWSWFVAAGVVAVLIAAAFNWKAMILRKPYSVPQMQLRRLSNDVGVALDAAISPDGKLIAYTSDRAKRRQRDIWLQQVDGAGSIRLTNDAAGVGKPVFSSDGSQIAFHSERDGGGIYLIPTLGGEARLLVPGGDQPRFSPDGRWLMYWTPGRPHPQLFIMPLAGGSAMRVGGKVRPECNAVWSPDGTRILFQANCNSSKETPTTWVATLDGQDSKPNRNIHPNSTIAEWLPNPSRLLTWKFTGDLWAISTVEISADGTSFTAAPAEIRSVTEEVDHVAANASGRVVLSTSNARAHIWGLRLDEQGQAVGGPKQLTFGSRDDQKPTLSSDGGKLAFMSWREGGPRVFYLDLATGHQRELSTQPGGYWRPILSRDGSGVICNHGFIEFIPLAGLPKKVWEPNDRNTTPMDWSADGKAFLFFTNAKPEERWGIIRQLDLTSLKATVFLEDPDLDVWEGTFSPDGRWVVFQAGPRGSNGSSHIYVAPFRRSAVPRSEWIQVTHGDLDGGAKFSPDGKLVYYSIGRPNMNDQLYPHRFLVQRLKANMRPDGPPAPFYTPGADWEIEQQSSVGAHLFVFEQWPVSAGGDIYLLDPVKSGQ